MPKILTKDNLHIYYEFVNKDKYQKNPDKPVLVFLHGWLTNWTIFKHEVSFFRRKGYPVLYLDLRGHGLSDKPDELKDYDLKLMVEDLNLVLEKEKVDKIILIGYSMGGMVASLFALKYKEKVSKLVLIDSYYKNPLFSPKMIYFNKHKKFARLLCEFMVTHGKFRWKARKQPKTFDISKLKTKPDIIIFLHYMYNTPLPVFFATAEAMFNYDIHHELSELTMPVLVIASNKDQFFTLAEKEYMAKKIPKSKIIIMEGTHAVIVRKPEEIAKRINEFIA
jgi:pimeloyl-ACP methyl ester carboxylesterase